MTETSLWLSDAQFARLSPLLACDTRGVPRVDDRRVISGIIHVFMSPNPRALFNQMGSSGGQNI